MGALSMLTIARPAHTHTCTAAVKLRFANGINWTTTAAVLGEWRENIESMMMMMAMVGGGGGRGH
jgi:hypothetical protein